MMPSASGPSVSPRIDCPRKIGKIPSIRIEEAVLLEDRADLPDRPGIEQAERTFEPSRGGIGFGLQRAM